MDSDHIKKKIVYVFSQVDRIGHLASEPWMLLNIFPVDHYTHTIVTHPLHRVTALNRATFNVATRAFDVAHALDFDLMTFSGRRNHDIPLVTTGDVTYIFNCKKILPCFIQSRTPNAQMRYYTLTEEEVVAGRNLRRAFNIPEDAPIVTFHVREPGFLPGLQYHAFRDAHVKNYIKALNYLIEEGFYIIRLGDQSMAPVPISSPQLIDTPFHPHYTALVEPYFISESTFYFGTSSGPISLAKAFGIPVLSVNAQIHPTNWGVKGDVYVFKHYYSKKLARYLTYQEVLRSPCIDFSRIDEFDALEITVHENSEVELLASVKEMVLRLRGQYHVSDAMEKDYQTVHSYIVAADKFRRTTQSHHPYYALAFTPAVVGHEFIRLNRARYVGTTT